jgi:hypothetical protein
MTFRNSPALLVIVFAALSACGKGDDTAGAENTLDTCTDNIDNDNDDWVDCDDQDCSVFAVCVSSPDTGGSDTGSDAADAETDVSGDTSDVADTTDVSDTAETTDVADAADTV